MQGLADGYFVLPYTIGDYLSNEIRTGKISTDSPEFEEAEKAVSNQIDRSNECKWNKICRSFPQAIRKIMWEYVGMSEMKKGLKKAMKDIKNVREEFWKDVRIPGDKDEMNKELEKAGRVADFLELGELFAKDGIR